MLTDVRTMVFCTAYAETPLVWRNRYRRWVDAVADGPLRPAQIVLVDDGSPVLPGWEDTAIVTVRTLADAAGDLPRAPVLLLRFPEHLGRREMTDFPGWHRSFAFAALYAQAQGFARAVHLESDAFLISARAHAWAAGVRDAWVAPWSPGYGCPEIAIQVAHGTGIAALGAFARLPYSGLAGRAHEEALPLTGVDRTLRGDRWGETHAPVPADADYAAQVPVWREDGYCWWLGGEAPVPVAVTHRLTLRADGDGLSALGPGWAPPEAQNHWMLGVESVVRLPVLPGEGDGAVRLCVAPDRVRGEPPRHRLAIEMNGHRLREVEVVERDVMGATVPAAAFHRGAGGAGGEAVNLLRLVHPDARPHSMLDPTSRDHRRLSMSVEWIVLERA